MKRFMVVLIVLALSLGSAAFAAPTSFAGQPKVSVILFLSQDFLTNEKAMNIIRTTVQEKFPRAEVIYYGDSTSKTPEFLEFIEKVKTDPVNERRIRFLNQEFVSKYCEETKSDYVVFINIFTCDVYANRYNAFYGMQQEITVFDRAAGKNVEKLAWYNDETSYFSWAAEVFMKKMRTEFNWHPAAVPLSEPKDGGKLRVIVFLPDTIHAKDGLVEKVRQAVAAKFKVADVPVHLDNKPKTQSFVDLITKVEVDSAKQKTFILKKEHLVEYGKSTSADTVVAINFNTMASDYSPFDFAKFVNLNEDISVIDVETGKYVQNTVFGTGDTISRPKAIDRLLEKLTAEFMLKPQKQQ